ncbi:MAG: hypothetical protein I3J02_11150 [Prevotella sp.]|nr:hypothetical protein [Prevotella sp.]
MKRFFYILSLIFTLTIVSHTEILARKTVSSGVVDLSGCPRDASHRRDALYEVRGTENSHEAVLDNTQDSFRTTNTRPVRLLPAFQAPAGETVAGTSFCLYPLFSSYYPSVHARPTSPIRPYASVCYYVYLLRHIIC